MAAAAAAASAATRSRGAFIVLEGLDRAGKSSQVAMLLEALAERKLDVVKRNFPDRSTPIGSLISDYLTHKVELPHKAVHLLFSANRWEKESEIRETLERGTTIVCDRYAASGAVYCAANTNEPLDRAKASDCGLPAPDLVLFLHIDAAEQEKRAEWGGERFERADLQRRVAANFREIEDGRTWRRIDAASSKEEVHERVLKSALECVEACKAGSRPLAKLYLDEVY